MMPILKFARDFRNLVPFSDPYGWIESNAWFNSLEIEGTQYPRALSLILSGAATIGPTGTGTTTNQIKKFNALNKDLSVDLMIQLDPSQYTLRIELISGSGYYYQEVSTPNDGKWHRVPLRFKDWQSSGVPEIEEVTAVRFRFTRHVPNSQVIHKIFFGGLYSPYTAQVVDHSYKLSMNQTLFDTGNIEFQLPVNHPSVREIEEWNTVEVYLPKGNDEVLIATGYVLKISFGPNVVTYTCLSEEKRWDRVLQMQEWALVPGVSNFHSYILLIFNGMNNATGLTVVIKEPVGYYLMPGDFNYLEPIPNPVKFDAGETILSLMRRVCDNHGLIFTIRKGVFYIGEMVGEDKTTNPGMVQLLWNDLNPTENTIVDYNVSYLADEIVNRVRAVGQSVVQVAEGTTQDRYGVQQEEHKYETTQPAISAQVLLNRTDGPQRLVSVDLEDSIDFTNVNIGDIVRVTIITDNPRVNLDIPMVIEGRNALYENAVFTWSISLREHIHAVTSFRQMLSDLKTRIMRLERQS